MKKIMSLCLMLMCQLALMGQARLGADPDYNPGNPDDPNHSNTRYTLTLKASPKHAGDLSWYSEEGFVEGDQVWVEAYSRNEYRFVNWIHGDSVVSTSPYFVYTMPAKNVTLTAVFNYDPQSPANPDSMALSHTLIVEAHPRQGGSFNVSRTRVPEGNPIDLWAYPHHNYQFKGWKMGDELLSTEQVLYYTMGNEDTHIVGVFEYNPTSPSNPGSNAWNPATGEIVVDDFTLGNLSDAIYNTLNKHNSWDSDVTMITVAGKMNEWDFSIANNFYNCTLLDLSRSYGYTYIPDWAFDWNSSLQHIILPAEVEHIGYCAFNGCSNLSEITCYAITPPTLDYDAFWGIAEGAVLHVLAAAIPLYAEADGWKDYFTIMPLTEEVRTLEVNLPAGSEDGRYKNMTLELVNVESGRKQKYVISDRVSYSFSGLLKKNVFNIYVRNSLGYIIGQIDNVEIEDEDVSVTFESLLQPQDVTLSVLTAEGKDVTSQVQATWFEASTNTYLSRGNMMKGVTEGTDLTLRVVLPQTLGLEYVAPSDIPYTVQSSENKVVVALEALPKVTISGTVKDITTGSAIAKAVVSVSQALNGKYSKAFTAKTDNKGVYSLTVYNAPSTLTLSATDYISQTFNYDDFTASTELGTVSLKAITGATVTTSFTYRTSVEEGGTPDIQNWYSDYANITYSIYNKTQQKPINDFSVQYPSIVLLEEVAEGDELQLTATSKNGAFVAVEATAVIDSKNRAEAVFDIVALGGIKASFASTDNSAVVGILYNANGQLMKQYNYTSASITINDLQDGNYTMVSMGSSRLFNSIYNLSQLPSTGLKEGTDYVQNTVTVESGLIATISNDLIPTLDESKLYYTGDNTLFSVNKTSVTAGNYLTLKGKIDFKDAYASKVSNVNMVIDLPESAEFVENSVMVGTSTAGYMLDGNRLTIPLERYTDQVRFCIIPTAGGDYAPNAFAQFTIEGKEVLQPIGSAYFTIKDLSISVPTTVAKMTIPVSGTALGSSTVQIYDNGVLIGETTSLANGAWSTTCELDEPYNLSTHKIHAKVINKQGVELISETKMCKYDMNAIDVNKVTMLYNGFVNVFDFKNPSNKPQSYTYSSNTDFTFTIDFNDNDTTKISDVVLYVKTMDNMWHALTTAFDNRKKVWVTNIKSSDLGYSYPVNVSVDFNTNTSILVDREVVDFWWGQLDSLTHELSLQNIALDSLFSLADAEEDDYKYLSLQQEIAEVLNLNMNIDSDRELMTDLEFEAFIESCDKNASLSYSIDSLLHKKLYDVASLLPDDFTGYMDVLTCNDIREEDLDTSLYQKIYLTDDSYLYVKTTETEYELIDFKNNIRQIIKDKERALVLYSTSRNGGSLDALYSYIKEINKVTSDIRGICSDIASLANELIDGVDVLLREQTGLHNLAWNELWKIQQLKDAGQPVPWDRVAVLRLKVSSCQGIIKGLEQTKKVLSQFQFGKVATKGFSIWSLIDNGISAVEDLNRYIALYNHNKLKNCPYNQSGADAIRSEIVQKALWSGAYYAGNIALDLISLNVIPSGLSLSVTSGGASLVCVSTAIAKLATSVFLSEAHSDYIDQVVASISTQIDKLKCTKDPTPGDGGGSGGPGGPGGSNNPGGNGNSGGGSGQGSGIPDIKPIIDPSGYVYEGVSSNRIEGVMASCYYKETVEDMYGDLHESVVLWDAEQYAQENPLFTDEYGMYAWDVPQGLWRVKFEKEGYETTYSEWLPVPPPQLEVNVAIKQNTQPEVKTARAYEDAIEVEFSKYMQPELLNVENIVVTKNGEPVVGEVKLLNEEQAYEGKDEKYASKLRFVPEESFLATDDVVLTISRKVKNYAGIQMAADYTQAFDIEKEVKSIVADAIIEVPYTGTKQIVISALPYDAAVGKTLVVKSSSSMIASVSEETVVMDEKGQATVRLRGELPGTSVITFALVDADVTGMSTVQVAISDTQVTADPKASRVSGTAVYRNTELTLSCDTKDAVIYYTLDGSCPCDEDTRFVYDGRPIIVEDDMTLKVMAVAEGMFESDVIEYNYTIKKTALAMNLKEGWNWVSHNVETAIAATELQENATRIVSQTEELINDPVYGLVGSLDCLRPTESYKVKVSKDTKHTLKGCEYNAATPISVSAGWNWLGYPANQVMSVNEAFANSILTEGDYIVGQDGFAQYSEGEWKGTLLTLVPGYGYLYHAQKEGTISYNTAIVSKAKALYGRGIANETPWTANKYKYSKVMCLIADLYDNNVLTEDYYVGAFCGTECRGVGKYIDGKLMMNIYGEGSEKISFIAMHRDTEATFNVAEEVVFEECLLGSMNQAYSLHIGEETVIANVEVGLKVRMEGDDLFLSLKGVTFDYVTLTDVYGNVALMVENVAEGNSIDCAALPDGVYIVTVAHGEVMYYEKILKM